MTPQIFIKLTQQIARQTPEAEALEAQALALQPNIDSAQAWVDSCQASVDAAQAVLTEASATEGADTTAQQDALNAANETLSTAKDDLAKAKAPQDVATAHAKQIRSQIAGCQSQLDASGMTMQDAEPAVLADRRAAVWEQIKAHRDAVKTQGVQVGANWFHSDDSSRIQQLGLVMMGANLPANVQWKTMSGTFVTMTPTLAGQIFQATAARDMAVFAVAEQHKAGVWAAADPSAYNWQTGWPASYQG